MNWPVKKLGNFIEIVMGQAPHSDQCNKEGEGVVFVKAGEFGIESPFIREWTTDPLKMAKADDTLICVVGATAGKINRSRFECAIGRSVAAVRTCANQVEQNYLHAFLSTKVIELRNRSQGAAQAVITREMLQDIEIPLPPLAEQQRITALLDTADRILKQRESAIAKLDKLAQSVFVEMFGDPVKNEKLYRCEVLADVCKRIQIGPFGTQLHEEDYVENGIPLVNPTHIKKGKIYPNSKLTISPVKHASLSQYHMQEDDIVLGRRGEMGRCAIVSKEQEKWLCGTGSLFFQLDKNKIHPLYLFSVMSSQSMRKHLESVAQGVTMANLNKEIVGKIKIPLPPMQDQLDYARINVISKNQFEILSLSIQNHTDLFSSLQHQSFAVN